MSTMIVSAATSKVTVENEEVLGLQSLEYVVKRRQTDIETVGTGERWGVATQLVTVTGTLRVKSLNKKLDELLYKPVPTPFNLVANLKSGETDIVTLSFEECFLDDKTFELAANGVGLTVYNFTATRLKEEPPK